jgi:hypothetical protein
MGEWRYRSTILDLGTDGGEWSSSRPGRFIPGKTAPGTYWIGGWMGPGVGLDDVKKRKISRACRKSMPGRPACRWTNYPDPMISLRNNNLTVPASKFSFFSYSSPMYSYTVFGHLSLFIPFTWSFHLFLHVIAKVLQLYYRLWLSYQLHWAQSLVRSC